MKPTFTILLVFTFFIAHSYRNHVIRRNFIRIRRNFEASSTAIAFNEASTSNQNVLFDTNSLSGFERLKRALSFYSVAFPLFISYKGLAYYVNMKKNLLKETVTASDEEKLYNDLHEKGSQLIVDKIQELKGFYVKTGQIISTRVDIFPQQYTSKLAITQDQLDPLDAKTVKDVVRAELLNGAELSELFSEFDDEPLGSASIGQVHRAKLLDGRQVAVKVQRPGIEAKLLGKQDIR